MGRSNIDVRYIAVSGTNLGGGEEIFKAINPTNVFNFKTIVAGANIVVSATTDTIIISGASGNGTGTITGGTNLGGGNGIYAGEIGPNIQFKTLVAGSNTTLTPAANTITIATTPAGSNRQLQYNNSGVLGASSNLIFDPTTGLTTNILKISSSPTLNNANTNIVVRNSTTGLLETRTAASLTGTSVITANNGLTKSGNNIRLGGALTGDTTITGLANLILANNSWTFGSRTGATAANSISVGLNNRAANTGALAFGNANKADGSYSVSSGIRTQTTGSGSFAQNYYTHAFGNYSHAGGKGDIVKPILASGIGSFNHSENNSSQTTGHGALASGSTILGGLNHNIESGNLRAAIIGGNGIKLTGTSYIDHTAVANLAIMSTPATGIASDDVLVRSATTGRIRTVTQASLSGGGGGTPAGSNTQIQYNNGGVFGASANLTFSTGTNTLSTTNLTLAGTQILTAVPSVGTLSDNILIRNTSGGQVQTIPTSSITNLLTANNGITKTGNNYRLGGALTGNTTISGTGIDLFFTNRSLTLGTRLAGTVGTNSMSIGTNNLVSATNSLAIGSTNSLTGVTQAFAIGNNNLVRQGIAIGNFNSIQGGAMLAVGSSVSVSGNESVGFGRSVVATGAQSFAGGSADGAGSGKEIRATGAQSFNFSNNTFAQVAGHGALAANSTILGGSNHNIESSNTNAAIIGGSGIKLTGSTYQNTTAVSNFAIMTTPPTGVVTDDILVRSVTTGKINRVTQSTFITANNGLTKIGSNIRLGGTLTGDTLIDGTTRNLRFNLNSLTFGSRTGSTGFSNVAFGLDNEASFQYAFAVGRENKASNFYSVAMGAYNKSTATGSVALGVMTTASGAGSVTSGSGWDKTKPILASGEASFNHSFNNISQTAGHGALAQYSAILGGINHNIDATNTGAVILGGSTIKLSATTYQNTVAVPQLAVMTAPTLGLSTDDVLVRRSSTGKIFRVTQDSLKTPLSNHNNIVYVSANGNDSTGLVNNINRPFATINAGYLAANSIGGRTNENRVLIYVLPGAYTVTSNILLGNHIDFYFSVGTVITAPTTSSMFQWNATTNNIYGYGSIIYNVTTANSLFTFANQGSITNIIQLNTITIDGSAGGKFINDSSMFNNKIYMKIDRILLSNNTSFGTIANGVGNTSEYHLDFTEFIHTGAPSTPIMIQLGGGVHKFYMRGNKFTATSFTTGTAMLQSSGGGSCYVNIVDFTSSGMIFDLRAGAKIRFSGKITHTSNPSSFGAIYFTDNTASLHLDSGVVITTPSTNSIVAGAASSNVYIYGNAYTNKAVNANVVTNLGTLTVTALPIF